MVDLILITFVVVVFVAGFMCGARFTTASNMWDACITWLQSKVRRKPRKDRRVADRREERPDLRHVTVERRNAHDRRS